MNKTLIIGIVFVLIIGLGVIVYQIITPTQPITNPSINQSASFPIAPSAGSSVTATSSMIQNTVSVGGSVQTLNFINDPATVRDPINSGFYYLGYHQYEGVPDPTATATPPYVISYESTTQYFNIALLQEPIGPVRESAQQYLMTHLGITQDKMCLLSYMVSVPNYVNSQYAGRNLGFSFCPGATPLPQ